MPSRASGRDLARELPVEPGARVLLARADIADPELPDAVRAKGALVEEATAYRTREAPEASRSLLAAALESTVPDAIVFTSGSAVRGLLELAGPEARDALRRVPAVGIGSVTTQVAREHGFRVAAEARQPSPEAVAAIAAEVARRDA